MSAVDQFARGSLEPREDLHFGGELAALVASRDHTEVVQAVTGVHSVPRGHPGALRMRHPALRRETGAAHHHPGRVRCHQRRDSQHQTRRLRWPGSRSPRGQRPDGDDSLCLDRSDAHGTPLAHAQHLPTSSDSDGRVDLQRSRAPTLAVGHQRVTLGEIAGGGDEVLYGDRCSALSDAQVASRPEPSATYPHRRARPQHSRPDDDYRIGDRLRVRGRSRGRSRDVTLGRSPGGNPLHQRRWPSRCSRSDALRQLCNLPTTYPPK